MEEKKINVFGSHAVLVIEHGTNTEQFSMLRVSIWEREFFLWRWFCCIKWDLFWIFLSYPSYASIHESTRKCGLLFPWVFFFHCYFMRMLLCGRDDETDTYFSFMHMRRWAPQYVSVSVVYVCHLSLCKHRVRLP